HWAPHASPFAQDHRFSRYFYLTQASNAVNKSAPHPVTAVIAMASIVRQLFLANFPRFLKKYLLGSI
ncbi:hypothetical protein, partial [Halomonas sp. AOP14-E2-s-20]|uniref:hypothetical protein n=1 Tax=Halomonas sp. AOP14-E2-s-20 TaxID=3457720 RepID=UPI00403498D8